MMWRELISIFFSIEKKCVVSKNVRRLESVVLLKKILNLWQFFLLFVLILCQGLGK